MAIVEIIETKHVIVFSEDQRPLLPAEAVVRCTCGWKEKGYGERDCKTKGEEHLARVPEGEASITILPPVRGRR